MVHNVAGCKITDKYRNLKIFIVKISLSYIINANSFCKMGITYIVGKEKGRWKVMFSTEARYSAAMIWNMSDQRLSLVLAVMALLSLAFSFRGRRQLQPVVMENFSEAHLTPMQRQLMEMFISSDSNRLSKHEICNALWPKKDDANETLYALISRLKRELSRTTDFDIVSDRGRTYILKRRKSES